MRPTAGRIISVLTLAAMFAMAGCAYKSSTIFAVLNASSQTITVKTAEGGADSDDIEFTLGPGRGRDLLIETIKCPENYIPADKYDDGDIIPPANLLKRLEIWVDGVKLSDEVRIRELWAYFHTDYTEKYTLNITDDVIVSYLEE